MSAAGLFAPSADANLITNGSFEINGGVGQLAGGISDLPGWTVGATVDSAPYPFAFIVDASADTSGFPSVYSPPNLTIWGPGNGSNNGFKGSADGGYFLGVSGGYAATSVSQTISGMIVGSEYVLSYEWALAQFSEPVGYKEGNWDPTLYPNIMSFPIGKEPTRGFGDWQTVSYTFTATSTTGSLSFLATGSPYGILPFLLLDGVTLEAKLSPVPEPSTLALLGIGLFGLGMRQRIRKPEERNRIC